jgi:hypothetical protein
MATLPTPAEIRALSLSGEFAAVSDASIIDVRDKDVAPLYSATDVQTHTQWTRVVALHTAHNLHIQLLLEANGGNIAVLGGVTSRSLDGVGSRHYATGQLAVQDAVDWLKIPSAYLGRLLRILQTFPTSCHTTAAGLYA